MYPYRGDSVSELNRPGILQRKLSLENYSFHAMGEETLDGQRCFLLSMNPRRRGKDLLRGKLWVDAETYNIRRVEGTPAKNSWWLHDLHIFMSFAEVDGMWLRTFTHAVANVQFKGKYGMESAIWNIALRGKRLRARAAILQFSLAPFKRLVLILSAVHLLVVGVYF